MGVWKNTGIKPKALENKPKLLEHLNFPLEIFRDLSDTRSYEGMDSVPGSIKVSEFLAYCNLWGFNKLESQEIWELVSKIDKIWIRLYCRWREKSSKNLKAKAGTYYHSLSLVH